jgi:hypothetical protein
LACTSQLLLYAAEATLIHPTSRKSSVLGSPHPALPRSKNHEHRDLRSASFRLLSRLPWLTTHKTFRMCHCMAALGRVPGGTVVEGATCTARFRTSGASVVAPRPRAPAKDRAGNDPKQPAEDRGEEDDPDERHRSRTDHPAELDLIRVGNRERDQTYDKRDREERVEVQTSPVSLAAKALAARLHRGRRIGTNLPWDTLTLGGISCLAATGDPVRSRWSAVL